LKPLVEKPMKLNFATRRQLVEGLDAKSMSPLVQQYLLTDSSTGASGTQVMRRTVPVSWCAAGGTDTHKRRTIPKNLMEEMSLRASKSMKEFQLASAKGHLDRVKAIQTIERNCASVLTCGDPSALSRFCLDVMKGQRKITRGGQQVREFASYNASIDQDRDSANSNNKTNEAAQLAADDNLDDDLDEFLASI
jgi:hypothetical protein